MLAMHFLSEGSGVESRKQTEDSQTDRRKATTKLLRYINNETVQNMTLKARPDG